MWPEAKLNNQSELWPTIYNFRQWPLKFQITFLPIPQFVSGTVICGRFFAIEMIVLVQEYGTGTTKFKKP